jgi:ATP-dependent Zn protease
VSYGLSSNVCKLSILSSSLLFPSIGRGQEQDNSENKPPVTAIAQDPSNQVQQEKVHFSASSPEAEVKNFNLDSELFNRNHFEPQVQYLRVNEAGRVSSYYRLNFATPVLQGEALPPASFMVMGPIVDEAENRFIELLLKDRGFDLEERGSGNFIDNRLHPKIQPITDTTIVPWYKNPSFWNKIGEGAVTFGFCITGGLTIGILIGYRTVASGRKFSTDIRHFEEAPEQSFEDVGGCEHVVEEMRELSTEITAVREGLLSPRELPRGIIYEGGPGAGKTLLARATAGEVECPFMYVNSASITASKWAGDSTAAILSIFREARKARDLDTKKLKSIHGKDAPVQGVALVFLDEFDTIGTARNDDAGDISGNLVEYNHVVNALLAEMDGVDGGLNQGIIVLAATNLVHTLDSALLRPGRFSRIIHVPTPTTEAQRRDILQRLARVLVDRTGYSFKDDQPFEILAKITIGDTGDYLRGILAESVSLARREGTRIITQEHLFEAYQRQKFGRAHENFLSEQRQRLVAYHEHGHALVALACGIDPFLVSMKARGETGGRVILDPNATYQPPMSVRDMVAMIVVSLGGRAAELKYFGSAGITEGAAADLDKCRKLIRRGVSFGMIGEVFSEEVMSDHSILPDRVKEIIDRQIADGLAIARKILDTVGEDVMNQLVNDSLLLNSELTGTDALKFYQTRIPEDILLAMQSRMKEHLKNSNQAHAYGDM